MFTGLVEAACRVLSVRDLPSGLRSVQLDLAALRDAEPAGRPPLTRLGASLAIDGVCLTVAGLEADTARFDVVPETLGRTTLGGLQAGQRVNVERALRLGDRLDGHFVQGHVERTGQLRRRVDGGGELRLTIECGADFAAACLPKGSVTVSGVSLTLAELHAEAFVVALVPHTLACTTLGSLEPGARVNLEPDLVGQWVRAALVQRGLA